MHRTIRRLTPQIMPLTSICFGSRMSYRTIGRLREFIPPSTFRRVFREFKNHAELADSICTVREDQRRIPNRWQTHLPRLRRVRQLVSEYIDYAEELVKSHGHLDGLKEYAVTHHVEFWNADKQGNGLFYTHEYEYLYALHRFLVAGSYFDLAFKTQRILTCTFEQPEDMWTLVQAILGRLDPPSYEYQLDIHFQPRTDNDAVQRRAYFEERGTFQGFRYRNRV